MYKILLSNGNGGKASSVQKMLLSNGEEGIVKPKSAKTRIQNAVSLATPLYSHGRQNPKLQTLQRNQTSPEFAKTITAFVVIVKILLFDHLLLLQFID